MIPSPPIYAHGRFGQPPSAGSMNAWFQAATIRARSIGSIAIGGGGGAEACTRSSAAGARSGAPGQRMPPAAAVPQPVTAASRQSTYWYEERFSGFGSVAKHGLPLLSISGSKWLSMHVALMVLVAAPGETRQEQVGFRPSPGARLGGHWPCEVVEYHSPPKNVPRSRLPGVYAWCWAGSRPTDAFMISGQYALSRHEEPRPLLPGPGCGGTHGVGARPCQG